MHGVTVKFISHDVWGLIDHSLSNNISVQYFIYNYSLLRDTKLEEPMFVSLK